MSENVTSSYPIPQSLPHRKEGPVTTSDDTHYPIRPTHPGIGNRHSSEYLQGFDDGKGAALDAGK